MIKTKTTLPSLLLAILFFTVSYLPQDIVREIPKDQTSSSNQESNESEKNRRLETFLVVWQTINDNYFDRKFGGVDWAKIKEEFQPRVENSKSDWELHLILQEMISRLNRSHFQIIPPEVFAAIEETKARVEEQSKEITKEINEAESQNENEADGYLEEFFEGDRKYGIGIDLRFLNDKLVITNILENSSADIAGIKTGYILDKINGVSVKDFLESFRPQNMNIKSYEEKFSIELIESFLNGEKDTYVEVTVLDGTNKAENLTLKREILPGEFVTILSNVPNQYLFFEYKSLSEDIGYIKFNYFALEIVEKFCDAVAEMKGKDALIIDLRGNRGGLMGSVMGISSFLISDPISIGKEISREGEINRDVNPHSKTFKGETFILIDKQSYSAAEMFAAAMKENDIAKIIGETSAGEALPSLTKILPTGAVFLFPVANFKTPDGNFLEGVGVKPDIQAALNQTSLLNEKDSQLDVALKLIREAVQQESSKNTDRRPTIKAPPPPPRISGRRIRSPRKLRRIHQRRALQVIEDFIDASGGRSELEKIKNYRAEGVLELRRAGALVEGGLEINWVAPNKYVEIYSIPGAGKITELFDGENYYVESEFTGSDKIEIPKVLEEKSLSYGFAELLNAREKFARLLYRGVFTVNGDKYYLIEAITPNRLDVAFLFNVRTKLLYKRTSNYSGSFFFENFKKINEKILLPHTIKKGEIFTLKINEFTPNANIDDGIFLRKESCLDKVD